MTVKRKHVLNESETEIETDNEETILNQENLLKEKELNQLIDEYEIYTKHLNNDIIEKERLLDITMIALALSGIGNFFVSLYFIFHL
jgi:hypothetical protein